MQRYRIVWIAAGVLCLSGWARADEPVTRQLYGSGVHAYFAGQFEAAHTFLTQAAAGESQDPRIYYFRGLVYVRLGRPDEAKLDFAKGALLEETATDDIYGVDRALERVQGKTRLEIELARLKAKNAAAKKRISKAKARYNRIQDNEDRGGILEGYPSSPSKPPAKDPQPPKVDNPKVDNPKVDPPKKAVLRPANPDAVFNPFAETPLPKPPRQKTVAVDPKVDVPKTVDAPKVNVPKVDAPKTVDAPPAGPRKGAGRAVLNILGRMFGNYKPDLSKVKALPPEAPAGNPDGGEPLPPEKE